ncbi:gluconate 2-dehydrogenase subunit 3 family protein [Falsirhodobacter sp. 20TX0035]|uniref:gluconate 2-dehydrogenase subunit 3 family protein n=1 Tax=Falsirhodobacter sp. 20TX0035 TaxID=3022019 RepID=UPI00232C0BD3|nr:gluconate 2-dehydrogenase subunit 3 family protein [Falsirhodobacter sp. 20TX0035]MDB6455095.1 gluconate 2-dehydrogenase subunit 3 family protein [Falsirhodobacter sp. 20TX0035]
MTQTPSTPPQQGLRRRELLIGSAIAMTAATLGIPFGRLTAAEAAAAGAPDLASYTPTFFDAEEMRALSAICDTLIPADEDGPGALATNVPVFIDLQMDTSYGRGEDWYMEGPHDPNAGDAFGYQLPYDLRTLYRKGLAATDAWSRDQHGAGFADLSGEQRVEALNALSKGEVDFAAYGEPMLDGETFFDFLLQNTREGYLADPIYGGNKGMAAWVMIGFPGARASFLEWVTRHNIPYPLGPVDLGGNFAPLPNVKA